MEKDFDQFYTSKTMKINKANLQRINNWALLPFITKKSLSGFFGIWSGNEGVIFKDHKNF